MENKTGKYDYELIRKEFENAIYSGLTKLGKDSKKLTFFHPTDFSTVKKVSKSA